MQKNKAATDGSLCSHQVNAIVGATERNAMYFVATVKS